MSKFFLRFVLCLTFFLFFWDKSLYSQSSTVSIYDSTYIQKHPTRYSVRAYTAEKQNHLFLFNQKWKNRITFSPTQKFAAGFGFDYKGFAIDLGGSVYRNSILPDQKTKGFNFVSSLYRGRNAVDMTFEINRGFTETGDTAGKTINIDRSDVDEFNFGVNYNFLFNYRKFSFNAAMTGTQIQKKSAGTPMAGVFLSDINILASSPLVSDQFSSLFNPADVGSQINVFSLGLTGGYAYTLVLPKRFYITASLIPGISFSLEQSPKDTVNIFKVISAVAPKLITRDAIGYAGKEFYVVALFAFDVNGTYLKNKNYLFYTPEKVKLIFGYRIK